jgi:hypothetical protein
MQALTDWLGWTYSWLGLTPDSDWTLDTLREALDGAYALAARRGTVAGLRDTIVLFSKVRERSGIENVLVVEEPGRMASLWELEGARLDQGTRLQSNQVAALGVSASVGGAQLSVSAGHDLLFDDVASRFTVNVYADATDDPAIDRVRRALDEHKPAHMQARLCVIQPTMSLGVQSRLNIDAAVGRQQN